MIHFVGAGSGAVDLITVRGQRLLSQADLIIYAGSLVNPALLEGAKPGCQVMDSARMTLEEVLEAMLEAERTGRMTVRLHTGDPCVYGAIREQMDRLDQAGISYDVCHGASMAIFLSTGMLEELSSRLMAGGYAEDTPAAIVYKATWPDEKTCVCTVGTLAETAREAGITKTALILVGQAVAHRHYNRSELYHPAFTTGFREAKQ